MGLIELIFICYVLILLITGLFAFNLNKTQEDYLLAGRRLGPWVTAFSERASGAVDESSSSSPQPAKISKETISNEAKSFHFFCFIGFFPPLGFFLKSSY